MMTISKSKSKSENMTNDQLLTSVTLARRFPDASRKISFNLPSVADTGIFLTHSLVGDTNIFGFLSFCLVIAST